MHIGQNLDLFLTSLPWKGDPMAIQSMLKKNTLVHLSEKPVDI